MKRRFLTALVLYGFAIGLAVFRSDDQIPWVDIATNSLIATIGFVILHFRWRSQEEMTMTPEQMRDTFS